MPHSNLLQSLAYLEQLIRYRLQQDLGREDQQLPATEPTMPQFGQHDGSHFSHFVLNSRLNREELVAVLLALVPHVIPHFFDAIIAEYLPKGGDFPAFGGVKGDQHRGTIPTGETLLYILAGNDLNRRFQLQEMFSSDHFFAKENVLYLETVKRGEPPMSGRLLLDQDYIDLFTIGRIPVPQMNTHFPAQHLSTEMEWDDLVLNPSTLEQIQELQSWVTHNDTLLYTWGMHKKLKPGYRALFYGPPGTGKTLTASLIGKYTNKDVFRIDLSMVVSKYIGETEKNLSSLFDKAQNKNWILFFDEADAIFGKRTSVRDAHDKYANQEVSYLLQRIEMYPGLTILASNFKDNIDEAFIRRFNSIVYFPKPKAEERLLLWQKAFPPMVSFAPDVQLETLAQRFELTGSHIINIAQYTCLNALEHRTAVISAKDIEKGIVREYAKEGKVI
ncbi:MAG TPA: AAA family ATPase [Saprospiraceae bacterium]|nr:AAA family ATPase [Saprospiraceae bacterium]HMQ82159.1 AAA family ATPase [Saprospiraceae bacterium]